MASTRLCPTLPGIPMSALPHGWNKHPEHTHWCNEEHTPGAYVYTTWTYVRDVGDDRYWVSVGREGVPMLPFAVSSKEIHVKRGAPRGEIEHFKAENPAKANRMALDFMRTFNAEIESNQL